MGMISGAHPHFLPPPYCTRNLSTGDNVAWMRLQLWSNGGHIPQITIHLTHNSCLLVGAHWVCSVLLRRLPRGSLCQAPDTARPAVPAPCPLLPACASEELGPETWWDFCLCFVSLCFLSPGPFRIQSEKESLARVLSHLALPKGTRASSQNLQSTGVIL